MSTQRSGKLWYQARGFAKRVRHWEALPHRVILTLTSRHVKAQVVNWRKGTVDAEASSLQEPIRLGNAPELASETSSETVSGECARAELVGYQSASTEAARRVGLVLGKRACAAGIRQAQWSQPGRFHGKIRAFYEALCSTGFKLKTER
jgi:ribosomal protein L18